MMSSLERILRDSRRLAARSNAAQAVENARNAPQSLEVAVVVVATPSLRADGDDAIDAIKNRPVDRSAPEVRPVSCT